MARPGKAKVLSPNEFNRLISVTKDLPFGKRNVAILYCSFGLGLRAKEMSSLNIGSVYDIKRGELKEEVNLLPSMTKGEQQRHIYLTSPKVCRALIEYIKERSSDGDLPLHARAPLFKSKRGGRFSPNSLQFMIYNLYQAAGIEGASSHSGRRTFATRLIEKGVDIKAVSTLMGHKSIAMTAKYVENNPVRLKKIAKEVI